MVAKIIVLGSLNGQLEPAFKKLNALQVKQEFTLAIATGDLFSEDDDTVTKLLAGEIPITVSTYFTIGAKSLPARIVERLARDEDICENLHYLGKCSTTTTSDGIRIVALGGLLGEDSKEIDTPKQFSPHHTIADAHALRGAKTADIILTTAWPSSIRLGSAIKLREPFTEPVISQHVAELDVLLKPRYHLSSTQDIFFEREPFFHPSSVDVPNEKHLTRFISVASYGNAEKEKAFYAFNLSASADLSLPLPIGTTASPFKPVNTRKRAPLDPEPYTRFQGDNNGRHRGKRNKRNRSPPPGPDRCFFCLSNPNLPAHMVASIGEDSYLTVAKGPLTTEETNKEFNINYPSHILIIPLTHEPTLALIEPLSRTKTFDEMVRYKSAIQNMLAVRSANSVGAVTYEISRGRGVHTHWQLYPIAAQTIKEGLVEGAFKLEAQNEGYPAFENRDPGLGEGEGDFFRVWIWIPATEDLSGPSVSCITMPIPDEPRFDLQFGRRVLAKLLGLEKRLQWRDCAQTEAEETADCASFKEAFKQFDFTI